MSGDATALPVLCAAAPRAVGGPWRAGFRAMASPVELTLGPGCADPDLAFERVVDVVEQVAAQCTRFDPDSDLMRANRAGDDWTRVGTYCLDALRAAAKAHLASRGRFDPRVLGALVRLGYARSHETGRDGGCAPGGAPPAAPWTPQFDSAAQRVRVGPHPVDLGGIGKGLAVRWAGSAIAAGCPSFLLDAGGDLLARGPSPDSDLWRIAVEDPSGGERPVVVLALTDAACATSSIRRLRWQQGGRTVHHLVDPATGEPGGAGLLAVTVVDRDPAEAEVWSKVFFLAGADGIAAAVAERHAAALWVRDDGAVRCSAAMQPLVLWSARS